MVVAAAMSIAGAVGCESPPPNYPVQGQVLIDGQPATTGSIRFVPENGRPATSPIDGSGHFRLISNAVGGQHEGVLPGAYRVAVTSNEIIDEETARWLAPARYADFRTCGLVVNVDGPLDDVKIELTWEGAETSPEAADPPAATKSDRKSTATARPKPSRANAN